ncbi:MAG: phosphate acyltransferase PlsX [Ruminococcaceae bacterium]|nr:phosphate acyltransferase PlsX [Oscillospiraceae bacterium]
MKLIIDCMGGDHAPHEMLAGVMAAHKGSASDCDFLLVGNETAIKAVADERGYDLTPFEIRHTEQVITMDDDAMAWRTDKREASMTVALRALADGEGDAVVSCSNTGALFAGATMIARRAKGVHRAAIGTVLPFHPPVLLLDSGANVTVQPDFLLQFAVMGTAYMKALYGIEKPRVGLINNGTEEHKGTELQQAAYALLSACPNINFIGNVEAGSLPHGSCDVAVTDGFTGNITLKAFEGMGKLFSKKLKGVFKSGLGGALAYLLIRGKIKELRKDFDASEIGGSPILGLRKPVIKAHGSSKEKAFMNAIYQARTLASSGALEQMQTDMAALEAAKKAAGGEEHAH